MNSIIKKISSGRAEVKESLEIGKIVRHLRKTLGLTQIEAAGMCKVGVRFLSDLENGKTSLHLGKVFRVLKNFGLLVILEKKGMNNAS